jgi:hypothetical protein
MWQADEKPDALTVTYYFIRKRLAKRSGGVRTPGVSLVNRSFLLTVMLKIVTPFLIRYTGLTEEVETGETFRILLLGNPLVHNARLDACEQVWDRVSGYAAAVLGVFALLGVVVDYVYHLTSSMSPDAEAPEPARWVIKFKIASLVFNNNWSIHHDIL